MSDAQRRTDVVVYRAVAPPGEALRELLTLARCGLGASTGYMAADRGDWHALVAIAGKVSRSALELSALAADELPDLARFLASASLDFTYVSVHGPAKGWKDPPRVLARQLAETIPLYISAVVMHPETLVEPSAFTVLGDRLLLENMDSLKEDARTTEQLLPYFDVLPDAGFCFDIAHAYLNDPTMSLAHELLDVFGERLREVHLSSILGDGTHVPVRAEDVPRYRPVLERCGGVPWIFEAEPPRELEDSVLASHRDEVIAKE